MLNKIIIKLIMCKLGLKKGECFRFRNQLNRDTLYSFEDDVLMKHLSETKRCLSDVSLNFLLSDKCKITKE
jgi:hypothetical protein